MKRTFAIAYLLLLGACSRTPTGIPKEFAKLRTDSKKIEAVSPDGVVFRIRTVKSGAKAGVAFWSAAVRTHLMRSGYKILNEEELETRSGLKGGYIESAAPFRARDVKYLVGFFARGKEIVVVEAGGDVLQFDARRVTVIDTLKSY